MKLSQFVTPFILGFLSLSSGTFAQKKKRVFNEKRKIDVIIEVNGDLVKGEMPELHLEVNNAANPKIETKYLPGHLFVSPKDFTTIDTAKEIKLCFDNYSYKGGKLFITKFKIKMPHALLSEPYLIVSCYDFNNKDYKRWYESETNKEYAVDISYPGSSALARNK